MQTLLEVMDVSKKFQREADIATRVIAAITGAQTTEVVHAVDKVRLSVDRGEVLGLVGESGCGKSTLGRIMAGLLRPSSGRVLFEGADLHSGTRSRPSVDLKIQMIFQDPFASLNPRMRIGDIVSEAALVHGLVDRTDRSDFVDRLLIRVGLDPNCKRRYPHQFSGGQRQRIGIAHALAVEPRLLICDEAVSALDVSIRAQVLNLFSELRESLGLTYVFTSHDLSVVEHISDRVAVMYLGRIVELASAEAFFQQPNHPYALALIEEVPRLESRRARYRPIAGEVPSPIAPPYGLPLASPLSERWTEMSCRSTHAARDRTIALVRMPSQRRLICRAKATKLRCVRKRRWACEKRHLASGRAVLIMPSQADMPQRYIIH